MGQYEDVELGELYYNRFRYYDSGSGTYISQDPIGLSGGLALYGYVHDSNSWVDVFGLSVAQIYNITAHGSQPTPRSPFQSHHIVQDEWAKAWAKTQGVDYSSKTAPSILLDATPDANQHAVVTAGQNARRDTRVAAGKGKWSTSLEQELKYAKADLAAAGVPKKEIDKAMKETKKYFKACR